MIVIPFGFVAGASAPPSPAADLLLNDYAPMRQGLLDMRKLNKNYPGSLPLKLGSQVVTLYADIGFDYQWRFRYGGFTLTAHTGGNRWLCTEHGMINLGGGSIYGYTDNKWKSAPNS